MSDRIAVMHHGRVLQVGTPAEIYDRPATRFVAQFIGDSNFLAGHVRTVAAPHALVAVDGVDIKVEIGDGVEPQQPVTFAIRPEKMTVSRKRLTARDNHFPATIESLVYLGTDTRYHLRLDSGLGLTARQQNQAPGQLREGERVYVSWPAAAAGLVAADPAD